MSFVSRIVPLALALALAAGPASAARRASAPPIPPGVSPIKAAQQRRMMLEPLSERAERREQAERVRELRRLAKKLRASGRSVIREASESAKPGVADVPVVPLAASRTPSPEAMASVRASVAALANARCNDPSGDTPLPAFGNVAAEGQCETAIARFGDKMVAAWNDGQGYADGTNQTQGWATSIDGGVTWIDRGSMPAPAAYSGWKWTSDPVLAVNSSTGAFYFSALADIGISQNAVGVAKGRFNGTTFTWGTTSAARLANYSSEALDKEWIAVDPTDGRVYLSYTTFNTLDQIDFQWADSALAGWSAARRISLASENGWVQGSRPAVGPNGTVYVVYYRIGSVDADDFRIAKSTDRGASFGAPTTAVTFYANMGTGAPRFNRGMGVQFPSIAIDRSGGEHDGRIYLAWNESLNWYDDAGSVGTGSNVNEHTEPNNGAATATAAAVGQVLRGALSSDADQDWFSLPLSAGQSILAECDSIAETSIELRFNNYVALELVAPDGLTRLAMTLFDSGAFTPGYAPPSWLFTAPTAGTYYLRLYSANPAGVHYRLSTGAATRTVERGRDQRDAFVAWSDGGSSWSTPVRVSQSAVGYDDWLPEVAVAPDGEVACAWYDWRDSPAGTGGGQSNVYLALSNDGGATWTEQGSLSDVRTAWSGTVTNIAPNHGDYISLISTYEGLAACWADGRSGNPDAYMQWIASNRPVPLHVVADTSAVDLTWFMDRTPGTTAALYRQVGASATWDSLTTLTLDAQKHLHYVDTDVELGVTYRYQLGVVTNGTEKFYPPIVVKIALPANAKLAILGTWPSPARRDGRVMFSLVGSGRATLTLLDVSGRKVLSREVTGAGSWSLADAGSIRPGVYLVRIEQAGKKVSKRIVLL